MKVFGVLCASLALAGLALMGCGSKADRTTPPRERVSSASVDSHLPVTNVYHGIAVIDTNQWLENGADPAVQQWTAEQNRRTRAFLDQITQRPLIGDRLERLWAGMSPDYFSVKSGGNLLFALKRTATNWNPVLISLGSFTNLNSERLVLDPNRLNNLQQIMWYEPSLDGKWAAVCLSETNGPGGQLRVCNTANGEVHPDILGRVQGASVRGSAAWNADGTGLYYTRYDSQNGASNQAAVAVGLPFTNSARRRTRIARNSTCHREPPSPSKVALTENASSLQSPVPAAARPPITSGSPRANGVRLLLPTTQ